MRPRPDRWPPTGSAATASTPSTSCRTSSVPELPVEIMFKRVREGVERETRRLQTPWDSSSLKGDFAFNAGARAPVAALRAERRHHAQHRARILDQRARLEPARRHPGLSRQVSHGKLRAARAQPARCAAASRRARRRPGRPAQTRRDPAPEPSGTARRATPAQADSPARPRASPPPASLPTPGLARHPARRNRWRYLRRAKPVVVAAAPATASPAGGFARNRSAAARREQRRECAEAAGCVART